MTGMAGNLRRLSGNGRNEDSLTDDKLSEVYRREKRDFQNGGEPRKEAFHGPQENLKFKTRVLVGRETQLAMSPVIITSHERDLLLWKTFEFLNFCLLLLKYVKR